MAKRYFLVDQSPAQKDGIYFVEDGGKITTLHIGGVELSIAAPQPDVVMLGDASRHIVHF